MRNGAEQPLSIAAELALLFLGELEHRVAEDPDLLVSNEAVLSFAMIRSAEPTQWQRWREILDKYDKSELIAHMLGEPGQVDQREWESKANRLIRLVLESGVEFFHDPDQHGWASIRIDDHWENHTIRSRPSSSSCCGPIIVRLARAPVLPLFAPPWNCSRQRPCSAVTNA